ncbi:MAG TPA: ABC transporter substrate-binding protein [Anaerolineaceae bacterium]|nr:ABC transporter substrate-binding protein [Anaerolineaceae bacterium]
MRKTFRCTLSTLLLVIGIFLSSCTTNSSTDTSLALYRGLAVRSPNCTYGGEIKSVEALDEYTVRFTLCYPDSAFAAKLAAPIFAIQDSEYLKSTGGNSEKISANPNGTGPYILKEWRKGIDTTLVSSPTYWGLPAATPKLEFRWQPDQALRFSQYDFTAIEGMDFPSIVMTKPFTYLTYMYNNPDLKVVSHKPLNLYFLGFNNSKPPFDNVKVRKAFSLALDRAALIDFSFPVGTELAQQIIPTGVTPGRTNQMKWFEQDTEEALALLNEAGFDFTQEIQLAYQNSPMETLYSPGGLAQMVKDQLAEIGVKVIMRPLPAEELKSSLAAGDEMFFIDWYTIDYLDGVAFFDKPFISEAQRFGQPYSNLQAFIKNVRGISNLDRKQLLFDKMNQAVLDEVPLIPLGHSPSLTVFRSSLQNISSNAYYENIEQIVSDKEIIRFIGPSEPLSLWPADEDDYATFRITRLLYDTLLAPGFGGQKFTPLLAENWQSNDALTEWTFQLRYNVQFSNGSQFDANDVVNSFAAIWDASSPYHQGRSGEYAMFKRLFGSMINSK